jgi:hypothetical protein
MQHALSNGSIRIALRLRLIADKNCKQKPCGTCTRPALALPVAPTAVKLQSLMLQNTHNQIVYALFVQLNHNL